MNQRVIDLFNNKIKNLTDLTAFDPVKEKQLLQAKKDAEDQYHKSAEYLLLTQQIETKKAKISENTKIVAQNKNLSALSAKLEADKHILQCYTTLRLLLSTRCKVETCLAIVSSTSCTQESLKDLSQSLQEYHATLSQEIPFELESVFLQYKNTYHTYLNTSTNTVSLALSNILKTENFPFEPLSNVPQILSYVNFLRIPGFGQDGQKTALSNSLMTNPVLRVQRLFQREESKLYKDTSLDLLIPYIKDLIVQSTKCLKEIGVTGVDLMSPFLPTIQFRMAKDIPQLPPFYVVLFLESYFECGREYPLLMKILKENSILQDVGDALREAAKAKVEEVIVMENENWPLVLNKGVGEFLLVMNEAVSFCVKGGEFGEEMVVTYVFEMVNSFEEYLKGIEMVGLKEVCEVANSWMMFSLALINNTERLKKNGINTSILLSRADDCKKEAKSVVLVIVDDMDRLLADEKFGEYSEAVESVMYLKMRNEEIQGFLHPDLFEYFLGKMNGFN